MTVAVGSSVDGTGAPARARRTLITDTAAPAFVIAYAIATFRPFELLVEFPGAVSSVLLPAAGVGILVVTPTDRLRRLPVSLPLLAYVAWAFLSVTWTESPPSTLFSLRADVLPMLVVVLVAGTIPVPRLVRVVLGASVGVVAWSVVTSLVLPMSRAVPLDDQLGDQVGFRGTFGHKNFLGVVAVLTLAMALPLARVRYRRLLLGLLIVGIVGTRSATAGGGLLAVAFVWAWMVAIEKGRSQRDRRALLFASVCSVAIGIPLVLGLLPTLLNLYDKDITFSGRTIIWAESMIAWSAQPWHGYGFAGVWTEVPTGLTYDLWRHIGFQAGHAHNAVVATLLELGVVGLACVVVLVAQVFRLSARALRRPEHRRLGQWGLLCMVSLLVMALAEPLLSNQYLAYLGILTGVLMRVDRRGRRPRSVPTTTF